MSTMGVTVFVKNSFDVLLWRAAPLFMNVIWITLVFWWMRTWNMGTSLRLRYNYWTSPLSLSRDMTWYLINCFVWPPTLVLFLHQVVLLMEFQTFEDQSSAINQNTGVRERLADMSRAWLPGKKMAVGKPEYKEIIEERLVSISSCFTYTFEQLWSWFSLWLLPGNRMPV